MPGKINETGNRYGRWTVLEEAGRSKSGKLLWLCCCDCGTEKIVFADNFRSGKSRSCGCLKIKHGCKDHPLYGTWRSMCHRCTSPTNSSYRSYGGRGIEVFEGWIDSPRSFIQWIEDNIGPRPEGMTLDRIDVNGNYEPGNLRWADRETQSLNKRANHQVNPEFYKLLTEPLVFTYHEGGEAS